MKYRVKYYSLVEMLLVISIIMVLCGLVLAAIMTGREKSRTLNCLSNVSQMHSAFQSFAEENKKVIEVEVDNLTWADRVLQPVTKNNVVEKGYVARKVAVCPSDREGLLKYDSNFTGKNYINGISEFDLNSPQKTELGDFWQTQNNGDDGKFIRIRRIKKPVETIYYGDTGKKEEKSAYYLFEADDDDKLITRRHKKLANVLYFDGHAKSLNKAELAASVNKITKTFSSDYQVE